MFCGIFLPIDQIVWPFRVFSYVLPYRYAFRSTVHGEFIDNPEGLYPGVQECDPIADARCNFVQGRMGPQVGGGGVWASCSRDPLAICFISYISLHAPRCPSSHLPSLPRSPSLAL